MKKVLFLKGLPGSGKSTYAKELVAKDPDTWVRVNKDSIRWMLHDYKWSRGREKTVEAVQRSIAEQALERGQSVIVDNTHMSERHENIWKEIAKQYDAEFEVVGFFDTSVEECLKRDQARGVSNGCVGKDVIMRMFYQHMCNEPPEFIEGVPPAIICDIDGTLAIMKNRGAFEWEKVGQDELNEAVRAVVLAMKEMGYNIILLSGRDAVCKDETWEWLSVNNIPFDELWMRPEGSMEPDTKVKREMYEKHVKGKYNVRFVLDDRPCMVRMWRKLGLFTFDCGNGIEF